MFKRGNKRKMKLFASLLVVVFFLTSFTPAFIPGFPLETSNIAYAQDNPGGVWLTGDHHMHTTASDGSESVAYDVYHAKKFGLDFIAITNHGGTTNYPKIEKEYEEVVAQRVYNPGLLVFQGFEWNVPAGEHATFMAGRGEQELNQVLDFMRQYDQSYNDTANTEAKAVEALVYAEQMNPRPLVLLNHPSRRGKYSINEIRGYNDVGSVATGFEGAPGHQANPTRGSYPGTEPGSSKTYGGYDKMTAEVGGLWDILLAEGRHWFITANSDFHKHYSKNGDDMWPGEYSKTYVWAREKNYAAVLDSLRNGRSFTVQGDLINALEFTAAAENRFAGLGETLKANRGGAVTVTIKVRDPQTANNHEDNPALRQVQLISNADGTPRITKVFTAADWREQNGYLVMEHTFANVNKDFYVRVRGSNTYELNPAEDPQGEDAWQDLWFYSNPTFIQTEPPSLNLPQNVILLIGDGMGFEHMEAARAERGSLYLDYLDDATGQMTTHSADAAITDSSSAATAMASGYKINNNVVGMLPDGTSVPTVLELAEEKGLATGLVTTTQIAHATPAGFATHVTHRNQFNRIAAQYFDNFAAQGKPIEVLMGGGWINFTADGRPAYYEAQGKSKGDVNDNRNLIDEFEEKGYAYVDTATELASIDNNNVLGLFEPQNGLTQEKNRQPGNTEPHLADMTAKALEVLAKDPDGFFLMVEGGQIDWASHDNKFDHMIDEALAFDDAVKAALDFQAANPGTLVIVTADHETGGLNYDHGNVTWSSNEHTAALVPVRAEGPGAQLFGGTIDNTDLARKMAEAMALDQPLVLHQTSATASVPVEFTVTSMGLPAPGAKVTIKQGANNVLATLTTGAGGQVSYTFKDTGNYSISASKDGYLTSNALALAVGSTPANVATITGLLVQDGQNQPAGTTLSKGNPYYLTLKAKHNTPGSSVQGLSILEVLSGAQTFFLNAARLAVPETPPAEFTALYQPATEPATADNFKVKGFLWNDWSTSAAWRSLAEPKELNISIN